MKILFVYSLDQGLLPNGLLASQELIQFGISHISSCLKREGHSTELVISSWLLGRKNDKLLKKAIDAFKPQAICFSAIATQYSFIAGLARDIKNAYPGIYLLIGGVHPTLNPDEVISGSFDAVCVGEGEDPVVKLIAQLEDGRMPSGIPNLWIRHGGEVEKNPTQKFLQDLDSLPFADRKMWQGWMSEKEPGMCSVLLSRGCPFDCTYCSNHAIRKIAEGTYVRYRSPENIAEEIRGIVKEFPTIREIYLETETLLSNRKWCMALSSQLENLNAGLRQPLSFGANIRVLPGLELENIFAALKRCNFRFVNIGLESGSERVRRDILRRHYSNDDVVGTVNLARKYGLQVAIFNLIGVPGETMDDFKETVRINRICKPDWHLTSIFYPYPGTDLYLLCKDQELMGGATDAKNERRKAVLNLPGFSKKQIEEGLRYFNHYVYRGFDPDDRLRVRISYFRHVTLKRFHKKILKFLKLKLYNLFGLYSSSRGHR